MPVACEVHITSVRSDGYLGLCVRVNYCQFVHEVPKNPDDYALCRPIYRKLRRFCLLIADGYGMRERCGNSRAQTISLYAQLHAD